MGELSTQRWRGCLCIEWIFAKISPSWSLVVLVGFEVMFYWYVLNSTSVYVVLHIYNSYGDNKEEKFWSLLYSEKLVNIQVIIADTLHLVSVLTWLFSWIRLLGAILWDQI